MLDYNFIIKLFEERIDKIKKIDPEDSYDYKKYDDLVMSGRKRINKGTKNFKKFIE